MQFHAPCGVVFAFCMFVNICANRKKGMVTSKFQRQAINFPQAQQRYRAKNKHGCAKVAVTNVR